ncbi:MAG: hypothetical protein NWF03_03340 [Candidatus Bathyarchaeota archaeon]|nr:hypothetical protein [Candidatus Bathyarchaeota archaeon]
MYSADLRVFLTQFLNNKNMHATLFSNTALGVYILEHLVPMRGTIFDPTMELV